MHRTPYHLGGEYWTWYSGKDAWWFSSKKGAHMPTIPKAVAHELQGEQLK